MIVSSISFAISKRFEKHSLDVKNLARKGNAFTSNKDTNILSTLDINTIIQTDFLTVKLENNLLALVEMISHSDQVVFAVVNDDKELIGVIYFNEIRDIIFSDFKVKYTPINEVMHPPKEIIYPTDSMETVMDKFEKTKVVFLPVIKNGKYHGFISKSNALEAYRSMLKTMSID